VRKQRRLQKVIDSIRFSRSGGGGQSAVSSIEMDNGNYSTSETLHELLRVHFPCSKIITEPPGGWEGLELVSKKARNQGILGSLQKGCYL
jgi:hypothetical protein